MDESTRKVLEEIKDICISHPEMYLNDEPVGCLGCSFYVSGKCWFSVNGDARIPEEWNFRELTRG